MTDDSSDGKSPASVENAFWYWLAVLIFLFMGVAVVMALIQTHAR